MLLHCLQQAFTRRTSGYRQVTRTAVFFFTVISMVQNTIWRAQEVFTIFCVFLHVGSGCDGYIFINRPMHICTGSILILTSNLSVDFPYYPISIKIWNLKVRICVSLHTWYTSQRLYRAAFYRCKSPRNKSRTKKFICGKSMIGVH